MVAVKSPIQIYFDKLQGRYNSRKERWTVDQKAAVEYVLYGERLAAEYKGDPLMKDLDLHTYTVIHDWISIHTTGYGYLLEKEFKSRVIGLPEKHIDRSSTFETIHHLTWKDGVTTCSVKECEVNSNG